MRVNHPLRKGLWRCPLAMGMLLALIFAGSSYTTAQAQRAGDRFGLRLGMWPQPKVGGALARISLQDDTLVYDARVDEDGQLLPFVELFGLFNIHKSFWVEIAAGFTQRTDVEVSGQRVNPPPEDTLPRILLGEGRVDFIPLFVGGRFTREIGATRPHNVYVRGGLSLLIAAEQPRAINPEIQRGVYVEGTKAAFGFLLGGGGEYYLTPKFGLTGDIAYRLSDLNYTQHGDFNLSSVWISAGATLRVR